MSAKRHLSKPQFGSADEARNAVESLPDDIDVDSYAQNAYDRGLREDADDDGHAYWTDVHSQATADH